MNPEEIAGPSRQNEEIAGPSRQNEEIAGPSRQNEDEKKQKSLVEVEVKLRTSCKVEYPVELDIVKACPLLSNKYDEVIEKVKPEDDEVFLPDDASEPSPSSKLNVSPVRVGYPLSVVSPVLKAVGEMIRRAPDAQNNSHGYPQEIHDIFHPKLWDYDNISQAYNLSIVLGHKETKLAILKYMKVNYEEDIRRENEESRRLFGDD